MVKNLPAITGDPGDSGSIPGSGRSPGGGIGNPRQYSCLENPKDRGARWTTVHGVAAEQLSVQAWAFLASQSEQDSPAPQTLPGLLWVPPTFYLPVNSGPRN